MDWVVDDSGCIFVGSGKGWFGYGGQHCVKVREVTCESTTVGEMSKGRGSASGVGRGKQKAWRGSDSVFGVIFSMCLCLCAYITIIKTKVFQLILSNGLTHIDSMRGSFAGYTLKRQFVIYDVFTKEPYSKILIAEVDQTQQKT